jgi:DNA-binding response OmpR family regulator
MAIVGWMGGCARPTASGPQFRGSQVLVDDDERSVRRVLVHYLERAGLNVIEAADGDEALGVLRQALIELALVDALLPGIDGFDLLRRARTFTDVPILLVTARGEEPERVAGLELGADDYIVKPFSAPEVVARVRAHLRRHLGDEPADPALQAGSLHLDRTTRRCLVKGEEVILTRREFDLLFALGGTRVEGELPVLMARAA